MPCLHHHLLLVCILMTIFSQVVARRVNSGQIPTKQDGRLSSSSSSPSSSSTSLSSQGAQSSPGRPTSGLEAVKSDSSTSSSSSSSSSSSRWPVNGPRRDPKGKKLAVDRDKKPNIILIVTDDQDVELGSMDYMPKTLRILRDGGAHIANSFVTTPMCCPSRSSLLTGMYVHNHHVFTNNDNCSSPSWQQTHEVRSFATYLNNAGYRTGYFGKYLNEYNGTYIPPGWREWGGLIRNSRFYNYTVNVNGKKVKHGDDYSKDYYPDLITNHSLTFFRLSKQYFVNKPVMMVLSYPAPHGPEDAAPQYQHLFENVTSHRTASWNYAPNPDKQWILRQTGQMEPIHIKFTDALQRKRLQTLKSVDDAVERIYNELRELDELENTYIFYTSDHGYHLGQFGLVKGKAMPFDFDIRVPLYVRGPNIPKGVKVTKIALNLDIAPTFLDIAGIEVPEHMDGKSILKILTESKEHSRDGIEGNYFKKRPWRDSFLVESSGRQNADVEKNKKPKKVPWKKQHFGPRPFMTKAQHLSQICQDSEYKSPCQPNQKWECVFQQKWRIQKCRLKERKRKKDNCICFDDSLSAQLDPLEQKRQRAFLRDHVTRREEFKRLSTNNRSKRSLSENFDVDGVFQLYDILLLKQQFSDLLEVVDNTSVNRSMRQLTSRSVKQPPLPPIGCRMTGNNIINCSQEVYRDRTAWRMNKNNIDIQIKELKEKLGELKDIRKHLKMKRPGDLFGIPGRRKTNFGDFDHVEDYTGEIEGDQLPKVFDETPGGEEAIGGGGEDGVPSAGNEDECICDTSGKSFPRSNGRLGGVEGRGSRKDEIQEEKRRIKEERFWRKQERMKHHERKSRRKEKYENYTCNIEKMNCFVHNNDHWKTPPLWTDGPFCFCQNSNNNTYWCMRTINETHDFLFCEFITGFLSFFDMKSDPYQLHNIVHDVPFQILSQLHHQLVKLKECRGAKECNLRTRSKGDRYEEFTETSSGSFTHRVSQRRGSKGGRSWRKQRPRIRHTQPQRASPHTTDR